jgi:hypothetical protein
MKGLSIDLMRVTNTYLQCYTRWRRRPMRSVVPHLSEVYPPLEGGPPSSIGLSPTSLTGKRKQNTMERRKFTRFRTQDDAFAALRGDYSKVGKIYDISLNGLAFRYLAEEISEEEFTHLDIFLSNTGFHLSGVPCTVIYHVKEPTSISLSISPYRCGLSFKPLNEEVQNKLNFFLNNYTISNVKH